MSKLRVTLVQHDIYWHDAAANRAHVEELLSAHVTDTDVIVLPEMFNTGFTNDTKQAEPMQLHTHKWLLQMARYHRCHVAAGMAVSEKEGFYNRLLWVHPDGKTNYYDKHHLFSHAAEHLHYLAGNRQVVVPLKGWKIALSICYDIRFPVWMRNVLVNNHAGYDLLLNVANWPESRQHSWEVLLQARAIENQAYVVGVNRVGTDGRDLNYAGGSMVVDAGGKVIYHAGNTETVQTVELDMEKLEKVRSIFPFLQDQDRFTLL